MIILLFLGLIRITNTYEDEKNPKVISSPSGFFVCWESSKNKGDIEGRWLNVNGFPVSTVISFHSDTFSQYYPDIATLQTGDILVTFISDSVVKDTYAGSSFDIIYNNLYLFKLNTDSISFKKIDYTAYDTYIDLYFSYLSFPQISSKDSLFSISYEIVDGDIRYPVYQNFWYSKLYISKYQGDTMLEFGLDLWKPSVTIWDSGFVMIHNEGSKWSVENLKVNYINLVKDTFNFFNLLDTVFTDEINYSHEINWDFCSFSDIFFYATENDALDEIDCVVFKYPDSLLNFFVIKNAQNPSIIFAFNKFYLFYNKLDGKILCKRVNKFGDIIDTISVSIIDDTAFNAYPCPTVKNNRLFLVFSRDGDIYGVFLDSLLNINIEESFTLKNKEPEIIVNTFVTDKVKVFPKSKISKFILFDVNGARIKCSYVSKRKVLYLPQNLKSKIFFLMVKGKKFKKVYKLIKIE